MRIVVWNCRMGFTQKRHLLRALSPDIAVIPECSRSSITEAAGAGIDHRWFGGNQHKGLGILVAHPWRITRTQMPRNKWVVPLWITGPANFLLLAVWATRVPGPESRSYIGQLYEALIRNPRWFRRNQLILAGDFNSNRFWDQKGVLGSHSAVVGLLEGQRVVSAYHYFFSERQGEETRPTYFKWHRKKRGFHIDYIFLPEEWAERIKSVEVGEHRQWAT